MDDRVSEYRFVMSYGHLHVKHAVQEEIRLAVDTWARTLLPPHLRAISGCWDEYMGKAPVADRARMASFLVQLHPHFPSWQGMSSLHLNMRC
jgi:hypothetical protein